MGSGVRGLCAALMLLAVTAAGANFQPAIDLVRVVKSERKLYLVSQGRAVREFQMALGRNPAGHKRREGDKRTPEGRYTIDLRNPQSKFHKSIRISYPSAADVEDARRRGVSPGGWIMIHGQKNGFGHLAAITQKLDWTDGCIALRNADMDVVWELVSLGTPIEIVP